MLIKEVIKSVTEAVSTDKEPLLTSPKGYFTLHAQEYDTVDGYEGRKLVIQRHGLADEVIVSMMIDYPFNRKSSNEYDEVRDVRIGWGLSSEPVEVDDMIKVLTDAKKFRSMVLEYIEDEK